MTQVSIHETSRSMSSRSGTQNGKAKHTDIVTTVVMMVQNKPRDDDAIWRFGPGQRDKRVITRIRPCPTQLVTAHMILLRSARKVVCTAHLAGMLEHSCTLTPTSFSPGPKALSAQKTIGQMMELEGDAQLEMGCTVRLHKRLVGGAGPPGGSSGSRCPVIPGQWTCMACHNQRCWPTKPRCYRCGSSKDLRAPFRVGCVNSAVSFGHESVYSTGSPGSLAPLLEPLGRLKQSNKFGRHLRFDSTTSALALVHLLPGMAQAAGLTIRLLSRLSAFPPPIHASTWRCCPSRIFK